MTSADPHPPPDRFRLLARALAGCGIFALLGAALCLGYRYAEMHRTLGRASGNIHYYLLVHFETLQFAVTGVVMLLLAALVARKPALLERALPASSWKIPPLFTALIFSLAALAICAAGTFTAYHNFPLCIDEYLPTYQAKLFARGQIFAQIPEEWRAFAPAMTTIFLIFDPENFRWTQVFLPVNAAFRALLSFVGLDAITGALLAALSVWATCVCARRLWPDKPRLWLLAGGLVLANTQVLITGMTAYAWPGHLALNMIFLACYLSPGAAFWAAPWVGLLAMGLHQAHVHPLFAFPLVLRFAWQRRWTAFLYYGVVYVVAFACWVGWMKLTHFGTPHGEMSGIFALPSTEMLSLQWCNAALLLSWSTPLLWALVIVAWTQWGTLPPFARDLTAGLALSFVFYCFFPHNQGHGWGYRFLHGFWGSAALLAAWGWERFDDATTAKALRGALVLSLGFTAMWQLPARLWEIDRVVEPFASASRKIESAPYDFLILDPRGAWYSCDLVRNDPFLTNKPKIMWSRGVTKELYEELEERGKVGVLRGPHLRALGLQPGIVPKPATPPPQP